MKMPRNAFAWLYGILVLFDLVCGFESLSKFRVVSKPLLLLSLLIYFIVNARANRNLTFYLMVSALFCSLLGDIFLLFETTNSLFFTLGLASFLVAHVLFTCLFMRKWNRQADTNFKWIILSFFTYGIILFFLLKDSLGSLKIPVILYILGILTMVITAYKRKESVPKSSFNLVFLGALFFVVSDSVLAIDKFLTAIPLSHSIIMGTYATAQYLILKGVLNQEGFEN